MWRWEVREVRISKKKRKRGKSEHKRKGGDNEVPKKKDMRRRS